MKAPQGTDQATEPQKQRSQVWLFMPADGHGAGRPEGELLLEHCQKSIGVHLSGGGRPPCRRAEHALCCPCGLTLAGNAAETQRRDPSLLPTSKLVPPDRQARRIETHPAPKGSSEPLLAAYYGLGKLPRLTVLHRCGPTGLQSAGLRAGASPPAAAHAGHAWRSWQPWGWRSSQTPPPGTAPCPSL